MDQTANRLSKCFETVFSGLPASMIPLSSQATLGEWDSVAAITLVNVIEDEFEIQVDFDLLPELDSFERILAYIRTQANS